MLLVFSTNRVKLVARKPETTNKSGQREYIAIYLSFLPYTFFAKRLHYNFPDHRNHRCEASKWKSVTRGVRYKS